MNKILEFLKANLFNVASWGVTALVVAALLGSAFWWTQAGAASPATRPIPTAAANQQPSVNLPTPIQNTVPTSGIGRQLQLKTDVSQQSSYTVSSYEVVRGDSVFAIAKQFNIKPETILYSNKNSLHDNPSNLAPGMTLVIPPADGLTYTWQADDTIDSVAAKFYAKPEDILNWPGNGIDLTNPQIKPGTVIMIPGGHRELISWMEFVPTINRANGTATSELSGGSCNPGPVGMPGLWPTNGPHTISGNDFTPTHLGIDITAFEGTPVLASGAGVVVFASWSQYGYGNVIQIDHGNGYATVYAHLSQFNVTRCEPVMQGQVIALSGSTGNSTGPHLHFEVRLNGVNLNPWFIVH